jgi:hypothetical protein
MATINAVLLRRTLAHIEALPDGTGWEQGSYRCNTGMCFAGWAAELGGGVWATDATDQYASMLIPEPGDELGRIETMPTHGQVVYAPRRAERILGLTDDQADRLFDPDNDLSVLREIVAELIYRTHYVTIEPLDPVHPSRVAIAEHRPGELRRIHSTDGGIPLEALPSHAQRIAEEVGAPYIEPLDRAVAHLLAEAQR